MVERPGDPARNRATLAVTKGHDLRRVDFYREGGALVLVFVPTSVTTAKRARP